MFVDTATLDVDKPFEFGTWMLTKVDLNLVLFIFLSVFPLPSQDYFVWVLYFFTFFKNTIFRCVFHIFDLSQSRKYTVKKTRDPILL